jgi:hypothetical protein
MASFLGRNIRVLNEKTTLSKMATLGAKLAVFGGFFFEIYSSNI